MKFSVQDIITAINTVLVVVLFYLNKRNGRIAIVPYIDVNVVDSPNGIQLDLRNQGEVFALDVDVFIIGHLMTGYDKEEKRKLKADLKTTVYKRRVKLPKPDEEGWVGVYDRIVYYSFPKKKVLASIKVPPYVDQLTVIVQFRDPSGVNYGQEYLFGRGSDGESKFQLASLSPRMLKSSLRRELIWYGGLKDQLPDSLFRLYTLRVLCEYCLFKMRPSYLSKYTVRTIEHHSIPGSYLKQYGDLVEYSTEDRGKWSDI